MLCAQCKLDKPEEEFYFNKKRTKRHPWCRPCSAAYARDRRKKKRVLGGFCSGCYKPCDEAQCERCRNKIVDPIATRKRVTIWRTKNPEYSISYSRAKKLRVLEAYGKVCTCCKEDNFEFLSIDHINGGGSEHRKIVRNIYAWLIRNDFPEGFRVLCMNCNFALGRYGYCPHQKSALENPLTQISGSQEHLSL